GRNKDTELPPPPPGWPGLAVDTAKQASPARITVRLTVTVVPLARTWTQCLAECPIVLAPADAAELVTASPASPPAARTAAARLRILRMMLPPRNPLDSLPRAAKSYASCSDQYRVSIAGAGNTTRADCPGPRPDDSGFGGTSAGTSDGVNRKEVSDAR